MQIRNVIALAASLLFVAACGDKTPPPSAQPASAESAPAAQTELPSGSTGRVWPFLEDAKSETPANANLLARNYYVVLDGSGSMNDSACSGSLSKIAAAKTALLAFAESVPADANLGLLVFDHNNVREVLALHPTNRQRFAALVNAVKAYGGTPLGQSIELAYQALNEQARKQFGYGEYHLVVVTDGEADRAQDPTAIVNRMLSESPVILHTIGFCIGNRHSLNQPGRTIYSAADSPDQLRQQLSEVLAEAPSFTATKFSK